MKNKQRIIYTLKHREAFKAVCDYYCPLKYKNELEIRKKSHDMDKALMLFTNMDNELITKIHRISNSHHPESNMKFTKIDYLEMIFDWESSRYTKKDKPLNAYQTLYKYYAELEKEIKPLLIEMNLYNNSTKININIQNKIEKNIDDNSIINEVKKYIDWTCKYEK